MEEGYIAAIFVFSERKFYASHLHLILTVNESKENCSKLLDLC